MRKPTLTSPALHAAVKVASRPGRVGRCRPAFVRSWAIPLSLPVILGMVLCVSAWGGVPAPSEVLDPATGGINGKVAISVLPAKYEGDRLESIYPWGFEAHLTRDDDPNLELVYPCGEWFQPPPGRYRVRIEGEWHASPYSLMLGYSGRPFRGHGLAATIPVVDAGRVVLPRGVEAHRHLVLRLLHAGKYLEGKFPRWEVSRRQATPNVGDGLAMPAGPTIGALWDDRGQRYVAISRPFEVEARKTVEVPLERPVRVAHVVVQAQRHALASAATDEAAALRLRGSAPNLTVSTADRIYAIWYGVAPGAAELQGGSKQTFLEPRRLDLVPGRIERVVTRLRPVVEGKLVRR